MTSFFIVFSPVAWLKVSEMKPYFLINHNMSFFVVYVIICLLMGRMGADRTIGFWWAFIASLLLTPLLWLVLILLSRQVHLTQTYKQPFQPNIIQYETPRNKSQENISLDDIKKEKLSAILDEWADGKITEEQYKIKKEKIMLL